jgi:hypothetical protein
VETASSLPPAIDRFREHAAAIASLFDTVSVASVREAATQSV